MNSQMKTAVEKAKTWRNKVFSIEEGLENGKEANSIYRKFYVTNMAHAKQGSVPAYVANEVEQTY